MLASPAWGATITNGTLTVDIRTDNGAIDLVRFPGPSGSDFYNPGLPVSNFGLQVGSNTGTFSLNTVTGGTGIPVSVSSTPTSVTVTGTFNGVNFSRVYTLVPGLNVLRATTTYSNPGASAVSLSSFDTFDPDQGVGQGAGNATTNDVLNLPTGSGNATVAQASSTGTPPLTVVAGEVIPGTTAGFGAGTSPFGLGIFNGSQLNQFFSTPFDPNGTTADIGFAVGNQFTVGAGQSLTLNFDQAFGLNPTDAQQQFELANPEPTSMVVFGAIAVGGVFYGWRRNKRPAA
jgi:hypothetical protein